MRLQDLCQQYKIEFKRQLGQNLLLDENINHIMVDAARLSAEDDVIEVGAGLGALTEQIRKRAGRVLAVEIDRTFMPCLEDRFRDAGNVKLFRGDILNHRLEKLRDEFLPGATTLKMISNLPYYITTPILFDFWESSLFFSEIVVMVQEEVALRMVAQVDTSEYGVLTIAAHLHAEVELVHRVPRTCFRPQPRVDSGIVRLHGRKEPLYPGLENKFLMKVVRSGFSQRRKTLRNALTKSGTFGAPKEAVLEAFTIADINPQRRAETLSIDEFARLARAIREGIPSGPDKD
jgi:16S rRNA (adenine1518-N6/adenine1519-N6)-dimethyltransferase